MPVPPELLEKLGTQAKLLEGTTMSYGKGCATCHNTGYKGRAPLYEVLSLSDELRRLILEEASKADMRKLAREQGMVTLREAGIHMVQQGITTLDEVLGATNEDEEQIVPTIPVAEKAPHTTTIVTLAEPIAERVTEPNIDIVAPVSLTGTASPDAPSTLAKSEDEKAKEAAEKWRQLKSSRQLPSGTV
jgi:hypothetical protein